MHQKYIKTCIIRKPGELNEYSDQIMGRATDGSRFDSPHGQKIVFFSKESTLALEPTKSPIQWASGALFRGVKRLAREVCVPPPFSADVMNEWNYTSIPHIMHRDKFILVCITVKTHFLEKSKSSSFHSGGDMGF
jgi:hypothetical protein